jgi:ribosomal protein L40E
MPNWYAYRWVCQKCQAIHYFKIAVCRRCGHTNIDRKVNNEKLADRLRTGEQPKKTFGPENVEREEVNESEDTTSSLVDKLIRGE